MRKFSALLFPAAFLVMATAAEGGHELPVYPSYYPQEIRVEPVEPGNAARLLAAGKLHAYVGAAPAFDGDRPEFVHDIGSLHSLVVLSVNPASRLARDEDPACAVVETMTRSLAAGAEGFVFHPYPVGPLHGDFLHHADLADAAKRRYVEASADSQGASISNIRVKAEGNVAKRLAASREQGTAARWDLTLAEARVADFVASPVFNLNGWRPVPWGKMGWYQAYKVLAGGLADGPPRKSADRMAARLQKGDYRTTVEKLNLERDLVSLLASGCRKAVVGYTVKREYFSAEFTSGIENIAFDSHGGLNSAVFVRTVKLKDLPWNGWLRLGIATRPDAAWNPVAGFTDGAGRLIWHTVGDPAFFPEPYNQSWSVNRIGGVQFAVDE
ncbi:MAG: hypothetical protein QF639_02575 [Rhodospirillales bacterium]|jgi:hypothetical protein|nr:hypothetical protein [Rhodospirillales bacterium]MDP7241628.1 hypothetical protein [Rhodospirillales bacterium]HJO71737.1 hypothetical protein [Rhodospirillales bacterium]